MNVLDYFYLAGILSVFGVVWVLVALTVALGLGAIIDRRDQRVPTNFTTTDNHESKEN